MDLKWECLFSILGETLPFDLVDKFSMLVSSPGHSIFLERVSDVNTGTLISAPTLSEGRVFRKDSKGMKRFSVS